MANYFLRKKNEWVWQKFEANLLKLKQKLQDDTEFAQAMYAALCNQEWRMKKFPWGKYGCSWRYAGGLIAQIRDRDENYMDYYCSGITKDNSTVPEGVVTNEVLKAMNDLGWKPVKNSYSE